MTELSPQERFIKLLSFLKDPQGTPHPTIKSDHHIRLHKGKLRSLGLAEVCQEAIEILESDMFEQGFLKGNQRTPNIAIHNLENFVLQLSAAVYFAKRQLSGSLFAYYLDSDGGPMVIDHLLITAHHKMMGSFREFAEIVLNPPPPVIEGKSLINPKRLQKIWDNLDTLLIDATKKVKEKTAYDLGKEFILIFLKNIPKAPNNHIAFHITEFINKRQEDLLGGLPSLWQDTVRKQVEKYRKTTAPPTA